MKNKKKQLYCPECGSDQLTHLSTKTQAGRERYQCRGCKERTCFPLDTPPESQPYFETEVKPAKRYVITSAQNMTPVHKKLWASLLTYCKRNQAELLVIPIRYKNPTSRFDKEKDWWAEEIKPYLFAGRGELNDNIVVMGDIRIQPTAERPLQGFEAISGDKSAVFGHPRVALECVATPQNELPKMLWTTGSVSKENYTDSKAGKKGEFHHSFGAVVVEIANSKEFHVRQLNAERNGRFIDIAGGKMLRYTPDGVEDAPPAAGLVMGDWHIDFRDSGVEQATFGKGGIVDVARPRKLIWHDVNDSYAISHHHRFDPFIALAKRRALRNLAQAEVQRAFDFIRKYTREDQQSVIVSSNHHEHLARWIRETDWRIDPDNAEFYLETALIMARHTSMKYEGADYPDPFIYWGEKALRGKQFRFLRRDESFLVMGIENGFHGDEGVNGSRGSIAQFAKIGAKSVSGHTHVPGIRDGAYSVGTSGILRPKFVRGLSSWFQTDCLTYGNGKRTLINIINGKSRL